VRWGKIDTIMSAAPERDWLAREVSFAKEPFFFTRRQTAIIWLVYRAVAPGYEVAFMKIGECLNRPCVRPAVAGHDSGGQPKADCSVNLREFFLLSRAIPPAITDLVRGDTARHSSLLMDWRVSVFEEAGEDGYVRLAGLDLAEAACRHLMVGRRMKCATPR